MRIAAPPRSGAEGVTHPLYVRRSRKKGSKTPAGVIYCGRPTDRGNPFSWQRFGIARCVRLYREWVEGKLSALALERLGFDPVEIDALTRLRGRLLADLPRLRGQRLNCWCAETARFCHVKSVLIPLANSPEQRP